MNNRVFLEWRVLSLQLVAAAILAACGGGSGSGSGESISLLSTADVSQEAAPASCTVNQAQVMVEAIRIRQANAAEIAVTLAEPRPIDLLDPGTGVLEALQVAPLTRDATSVRLRIAQGSTVRLDDGTVAPLQAPGVLRLAGDFRLAAGMVADLVVQGFDRCNAIHAAGRSGQFVLNGEVPAQVRALPFVTDREQPASGSLRPVPGNGYATVSAAAAGNFTIQRFDAYGAQLGSATMLSLDGMSPSVTPLANGFVLATWLGPALEPEPEPGPGQRFPLMVQRFGADGAPQGDPVQVALTQPFTGPVSPRLTPPPSLPQAAALADGGAALVWVRLDDGNLNVYLERFAADGSTRNGAQRVNVTGGSANGLPNVIGLTGDRVLVAWGIGELHARVFGPDGSAGPEQAFTPAAPSLAGPPQLAALADGGAAMAWTGLLLSRFPIIEMVRLAPAGAPVAAPQLLFDGFAPSVAALGDGGFVVAWSGLPNVFALRFNADGSRAGAATQVNVTSTPTGAPSAVALLWGGFLIGWPGDDGAQAFMRFFDAQGLLGA